MNKFALDAELKRFDPSSPADSNLVLDGFLEYVKSKGLTLYEAQEEAILALYEGHNIILNTPTGSGKSLVALALHFHSIANQRRSYYTCPIKALVNEKFLALCHDFGPARVGMITGEASVNPDAPIICCTAEILSNLALREGKNAAVDDVIMDEFHYYSDRERGVAWQIPLLTLPQTRFMLMSATLGDVERFEVGMTELNHKPTTVIKSVQRPVPLNYFYQETPLHETVQNLVQNGKAPVYMVAFTQRECAEEAQNLLSVDICSKEEKQAIGAALSDLNLKFSSPFGKEIQKLVKHGIGLHHAGLLPKYRYMVERLAQKGLLKVICGTDTLGVGVNIPIRTVLFTKLCKFDGTKTAILTVRDFKQIAGRAGRKGFDDQGYVVAQAPEHVIENIRAEAKAGSDPKKLKRIQKKKPPERGFVMWTRESFEKLMASEPEPLASRFTVSHGMLLNVLSRPGDGCAEMRSLIQSCHESPQSKRRLRKLAFQMFRSLLDRKIIEFSEASDGSTRKSLKINVDLQEDFSIHHALALYLIDTVKLIDPYSETYALDILSLCEAIIEDPEMILRKQLDRIKSRRIYEMKMEGMEYDERIAELEKLEYPKPNREFVYNSFNEFAAQHPWVGQENIRPKSIAREMYEEFMNFSEYIREYELQRSEGLLLRYLAEVYKVLVQTLPDTAKDEEMHAIIDYIGAMVRQVDSTLLDEWERLSRPDAARVAAESDAEVRRDDYDITRNRRDLTVAIRNEVFQYIKSLSARKLDLIVQMQREEIALPETAALGYKVPLLDADALRSALETYSADHEGPLTDRTARNPTLLTLEESPADVWKIRQTLVDVASHNDWYLEFDLIIGASRALNRPVLILTKLGM
jgi:superfamily II RNA helicase